MTVTLHYTTEAQSTQRCFVIKSCEKDKEQDIAALVNAIFLTLFERRTLCSLCLRGE